MKKGKKWKKIEAFCILLIVTLLLIFVRILYQPGTESERGELYTFSNGWYQLKDGKKTELKLPCFVTADKDGQIILYNDMLSEADKGKILSIRGIQDQLEVCIGDRLLYQYKDNRFEKNRQMKGKIWADISLPEKIGQEVLSISYETKKNARLYVYAPDRRVLFCFQTASARIDFFDTGSFGNDRSRYRFGDCFFLYQIQADRRKEIFKCSIVFASMQSVMYSGFGNLPDVWQSECSRNVGILLCVYDDACSHAVICTKYSE